MVNENPLFNRLESTAEQRPIHWLYRPAQPDRPGCEAKAGAEFCGTSRQSQHSALMSYQPDWYFGSVL